MKQAIFLALFFGLVFLFSHFSFADGASNTYGKFVPVRTKGSYAVTFVLNPKNQEFRRLKEVEMIDYGDDGKGNVSIVLYRKGSKEIFFRDEGDYRRYVLENPSANVCGADWSPKVEYRKEPNAWTCVDVNFFERQYMTWKIWWPIDEGLADAKRGDWNALAKRILENVKKNTK